MTKCAKCKSKVSVPPSEYCTKCEIEEWMNTCHKLIDKYEPLDLYFQTWAKHCGAPEDVFVGQTCRMLAEILGSKTLKAIDQGIKEITSSIESKVEDPTGIELLYAMSPNLEEDVLMALRFLYYVKAVSALPDDRYDQAERAFLKREDIDDSPLMNPGSDNSDDYPERTRALGFYIMLITEERRKSQPSI